MTEFTSFAGKEDRWGDNMRALWGNLSICPCLDYLELPYHTSGELLSISCLKDWGDIQEPCNDMAYLLVHTEDASEAGSYSMALVWISPHQARASTMEEALGTLSTCISSGPNWPYVLAQLYEGSSHTPLPKDKHLGVLPQGKAEESPYWQISQLKVCQHLGILPTYSSHSDSPKVDLMGLQEDANVASNYMVSVKRSSDLKRQQAIQEFEASLCQQEAKEATANEKAKIIHSRKNLNTKVGCAKAVMEAKYNYRMAVQEARTIRSNQLQESETAYSEALGENTTTRSTQSTRLHREHVKHMHELEEQAIKEKSKSCHNFLSACQAILLHALQPLKENLSTSYHVLLG